MNNTHTIDGATFGELQVTAGADFVAELVQTFAEEGPQLLDELRAALAAGAADRFRRAAHSLKSNGHTFGAGRLAEMARALELGGLPADAAPVQALADELATTLSALQALAAAGTSGDVTAGTAGDKAGAAADSTPGNGATEPRGAGAARG